MRFKYSSSFKYNFGLEYVTMVETKMRVKIGVFF